MDTKTTAEIIAEQARQHGIEFGQRYRDEHSGFEGVATSIYFFEHECVRVQLRGTNKMTGGVIENSFDAPELIAVETEVSVPQATGRTGGPRDVSPRPAVHTH